MEKKFNITFNENEKFYRAYVELLKPFLKGIRDREADVLAQLLYHNNARKEIVDKADRFKLILTPDSRRIIESKLNISTAIFRNALTGLRNKGILREDNTLSDTLLVYPVDKKIKLEFNFVIEN